MYDYKDKDYLYRTLLEELLGISPERPKEDIIPVSHNEDTVISGKKDNQYLSPRERETFGNIPDEALITIKKFDANNSRNMTTRAGYGELLVSVPIWSPHMEKTLLYALTQGTAYKIKNKDIYIWYKHHKGFDGSGFYRLKRFYFSEVHDNVVYILDAYDRL